MLSHSLTLALVASKLREPMIEWRSVLMTAVFGLVARRESPLQPWMHRLIPELPRLSHLTREVEVMQEPGAIRITDEDRAGSSFSILGAEKLRN